MPGDEPIEQTPVVARRKNIRTVRPISTRRIMLPRRIVRAVLDENLLLTTAGAAARLARWRDLVGVEAVEAPITVWRTKSVPIALAGDMVYVVYFRDTKRYEMLPRCRCLIMEDDFDELGEISDTVPVQTFSARTEMFWNEITPDWYRIRSDISNGLSNNGALESNVYGAEIEFRTYHDGNEAYIEFEFNRIESGSTNYGQLRMAYGYLNADNYLFVDFLCVGSGASQVPRIKFGKRVAGVETCWSRFIMTGSQWTSASSPARTYVTFCYRQYRPTYGIMHVEWTGSESGSTPWNYAAAIGMTADFPVNSNVVFIHMIGGGTGGTPLCQIENFSISRIGAEDSCCPYCTGPCGSCVEEEPPYAWQVDISGIANDVCTNCAAIDGSYILEGISSINLCTASPIHTLSGTGTCSVTMAVGPLCVVSAVTCNSSNQIDRLSIVLGAAGLVTVSLFHAATARVHMRWQGTMPVDADDLVDCRAIEAFSLAPLQPEGNCSSGGAHICESSGSTCLITAIPDPF